MTHVLCRVDFDGLIVAIEAEGAVEQSPLSEDGCDFFGYEQWQALGALRYYLQL